MLPLTDPTEPCWTKTIQPSPSIFRYSTSSPPACSNLVAGRSSIIASKLSIEIVDHKLVPESLPCVQQVPMTKQHSKLLEVKDMTYPHCKHLDALLTYLVDHPEPKIGGQVTCKWRHQVENSRKMSLHVHKMPHIYSHLWEHMCRGVKGLQSTGHLGHLNLLSQYWIYIVVENKSHFPPPKKCILTQKDKVSILILCIAAS